MSGARHVSAVASQSSRRSAPHAIPRGIDAASGASTATPHAETSANGATRSRGAQGAEEVTTKAARGRPSEAHEEGQGQGQGQGQGDGGDGDGDSEGEEYEIEKILEHRPDVYVSGEMAYFVSWVGYGDDENSWVREADAENAEEMLAEYWRKQKSTPKIRHISQTAERVWREQQEALGKSGAAGAAVAGLKRDRESGSLLPSAKKLKQGRPRAHLADEESDEDEEDVDLSTLSPSEREAILKKRARRKYERLPVWESVVKQITNVEKHPNGRLTAFVKFEDGTLLAFDTAVIHHRCPQKLIAFYETRLRFRPAIRGAGDASTTADTAAAAAPQSTN